MAGLTAVHIAMGCVPFWPVKVQSHPTFRCILKDANTSTTNANTNVESLSTPQRKKLHYCLNHSPYFPVRKKQRLVKIEILSKLSVSLKSKNVILMFQCNNHCFDMSQQLIKLEMRIYFFFPILTYLFPGFFYSFIL